EVIIQNFRAKPEIPMANAPEPDEIDMARTLATARLLLGEKMNVQAPPNLSPNQIELFLHAGINDWGGISPLSKEGCRLRQSLRGGKRILIHCKGGLSRTGTVA